MSWTEIMAAARRVVRSTFAENASYSHMAYGPVDVPISVSWMNRAAVQGNLEDVGYSDIIEGINRIVVNREELAQKNLVMHKGGRITLTDPLNDGVVLILDSMEPRVGPVNDVWNVVVP